MWMDNSTKLVCDLDGRGSQTKDGIIVNFKLFISGYCRRVSCPCAMSFFVWGSPTHTERVSEVVLRCRPVGFFSIYYYYHLQGDWYFKSVSVIFVPFLGVSICLRRISFSIDQNDLALFRVILQAFSLAANTKVTITLEVKCEIEDMLKCKKGKLQTNCSQNVSALSINDFGQLSKSWITAKLLWKHRFECWSHRHRYFRDCCSRCQMIK